MRDFELPGQSTAVARGGMAATSHPTATLTAIEILKAGGNAVDAAIAACAVQCVVEAGSTGIGGDCFAMIAPKGRADIVAYNGSGRTPADLSLDRLEALGVTSIERSSPHAVTIPGAVDAWCRLNADNGRMPMADILAPAIAIARDGYPITPRVAADLGKQLSLLQKDPATQATFLKDGTLSTIGDTQRQAALADTLEAIGRDGRDAFYRGAIAEDMVARLTADGGLHTLEDFAEAAGDYVPTIQGTYRGRTVHEIPPNGQGVVALLILAILSRFEIGEDPFNADETHILVEATRLAYAARDARVADEPDPLPQAARLLEPAFVNALAARIDPKRALPQAACDEAVEHKDTVYICVVDRDRTAVSLINSIFHPYGSGIMAPRSGVLFHNRGQSFSLRRGHPNAIAPRKRPMHTIIPGMVTEGDRAIMPFGVMGGHYQAMGHAHLLSRLYDHGLDLQEAISLPRLFPLPGTATIEAEASMRVRLGSDLEARGFKVQPPAWAIGGAQAIQIDWKRGVLLAGSDHRKDGLALGY